MNADEFVDYYIEEAKREYRPFDDDPDYWGDREAFRKHIEEEGEEDGVSYLY